MEFLLVMEMMLWFMWKCMWLVEYISWLFEMLIVVIDEFDDINFFVG